MSSPPAAPFPPPPASPLNRRPRWGITRKLGLCFLLLFGILGVAGYSALSGLIDLHHALHSVERDARRQGAVLRLASAVRDQYAHTAHTLILGNDTHAGFHAQAFAAVCEMVERVARQARDQKEKDVLREIGVASARLNDMFEQSLLPAVRRGDLAQAAALHGTILTMVNDAQQKAELLSDASERSIAGFGRHAQLSEHQAIRLSSMFLLVAGVFAVGMALFLSRALSSPIRRLEEGTARIASGDLDTRLVVRGEDELAHLAERFNTMTAALKEHQAKLVQSEKLAGLGRLAAGVAHEINNPLGVIIGYVKLLRHRPGSPPEMAILEEESDRCRQVVDDLLDLTRTPPLENDAVDLAALTHDIVTRLQTATPGTTPAMQIEGAAVVQGSARKLRQVIHNLVKNALEATPPEGRVTVSITHHGSSVALTVADSGPGIAVESRRFVFEPFYTTKPGGTGMGLAVSRAIARAHGGDLELVEQAAPGARFRLTLPATRL